MRNDTRTSARHSSRLSPRRPVDTTSTALMLRSVDCASLSADLTASSELVLELPTSSMIFVTAISPPVGRGGSGGDPTLRGLGIHGRGGRSGVAPQCEREREQRADGLHAEHHGSEPRRAPGSSKQKYGLDNCD